ncbi:MAG: hypothetical protein LBV01_02145 [Deltaproteobacteria bacterium]|jgi:hypothetical protein|nr:hypothetical protein [Deltaproteobacteria bacterium]
MAGNRPTDPTLLETLSSEVSPAGSPLLRFLMDNARRLGFAAVILVLGGAGYGIYTWHTGKQITDAQNELGRILVVADSADRLARLKAFLPGVPAAVRPAVLLSVARAASEAKDYAAAGGAWDELAKNPQDSLHVVAVMGKAEALVLQEKNAEALALAEALKLPEDSAAVGMVNSFIVDLAEKTGDLDKATAACAKLVTVVAMANPEEADFWRQKAASLELRKKTAKP